MDADARSSIESHHRESIAAITSLAAHFDTLPATVERLTNRLEAGGMIALACNTSALAVIGSDYSLRGLAARRQSLPASGRPASWRGTSWATKLSGE